MQTPLPTITEVAKAGTFGLKLPALPANPFVGLRPFNSDEALLYFGRREQTIELLQQLRRTHFVALVGSSGCGKSSLARAGLIPKLEAGFLVEERDQWLIATMKPGDAPINNMASALFDYATGDSDESTWEALVAAISTGDLECIIGRLTPEISFSHASLLLLVDQFEELFRFGIESGNEEKRAEATRFVELILGLCEQRQLPIYVVITMRSDFLGDCDNFYRLPEAMNRSQYLVPRLTRKQLRQAVEGPVNLFGAAITPQLVNRVLDDGGFQNDQLPVMQHALMRAWENWRRSGDPEIDLKHYEAAGGIKDALSRDAEDALTGMSEEELKITGQMFQALTDTDASKRCVRRPARLSEVAAIADASRETILKIIERFRSGGRSFLTVTGDDDPLIDISHESLIRQWERMSEWVKDEAESREIYLRLESAAKRRQTARGELWRGADLQLTLEWVSKITLNEKWAARYAEDEKSFNLARIFLIESYEAEKAARDEEELRRKRELRRARAFTIVISIAFLLALSATWYAWKQQQEAKGLQQTATHFYYAANMNLAQEAYANRKFDRVVELLNAFLPVPGNSETTSAREFYWYHLWYLIHQEVQILERESQVHSLAFSPDGRMLVSVGRTVKLWDMTSRQQIATLNQHEGDFGRAVFSPDGKTLALAYSHTIGLWDVVSRQQVAALEGHESYIRAIAFSSDGKKLVSADNDTTVRLWDVTSRRQLDALEVPKGFTWALALSPDGKMLASAHSLEKTVSLWDLASRRQLATLEGHESSVNSIAFSSDSKALAVSDGEAVRLWDWSSRRQLAVFRAHGDGVEKIVFSSDGKTLAAAGGKTVRLWDLASRQQMATLEGEVSSVHAMAFSPDGKTLALANRDYTVRLWKVVSRQQMTALIGHEDIVNSVAFSPDGKMLASASGDRTVKLWDVVSRQSVATLKGHASYVNSVAFSPDGKTLASASEDRTVKLWDVASRQNLATLEGYESYVNSVAFSPDGKMLASASSDGTIRLWDVASRHQLTVIKRDSDAVNTVAFSPDGKILASGGKAQVIRPLDVTSRQEVGFLPGHTDAVNSVTFSPDGKTLATASSDQTVRLWDLALPYDSATLKGHESAIRSVAFSPDGKTLASASENRMLKLWDVASRQNLATLIGHESVVRSVAFSPDGKMLASAGGDDKKKDFAIRLWFAATDEEVARQRNK